MEEENLLRAVRPYTHLPVSRLRLLAALLERHALPAGGAYVEVGCCKGGAAAWLVSHMGRKNNAAVLVHLFDSFAGVPKPDPADGPALFAKWREQQDRGGLCVGSMEDVLAVWKAVNLPECNLNVWGGMLTETLPLFTVGDPVPLSVLHVDVDLYYSTRLALEFLAPLVLPGGLIIVDDYGRWPGAKRAVLEYRSGAWPIQVDETSVYWVKE